jgi:predicted Zn-dependent peptidase
MIYKQVLDNGIRVVAERMVGVKSISIGLWVNIGSRDEADDERGMSHFLEHMFFKGTERRSAKEIARKMDAIGGEFNAFTSRETTTFYAKVLDDHLDHAVDILSDNFHHSIFDGREIAKEKQVVIEEMKMVEDNPEELLHDLHMSDIWKKNPLGRPILGTEETVSSITRAKILRFLKRTYDPKQIILSVAGHFTPATLLKSLDAAFGKYTADTTAVLPRTAPEFHPNSKVKTRKLEQVHLCVSVPGLSDTDPDRYTLYVLNTILGASVSSRLFQEVRERRGLAYSIYSSCSSYQGAGLLTVYAATSASNAPKAIDLICKELRGIKEKGIDAVELEEAKSHIKGSTMLGMESTSGRMGKLAKNEIRFGRDFPLNAVLREIDKVKKQQIQRLAERLFDSNALSLTALGNITASALPSTLSIGG